MASTPICCGCGEVPGKTAKVTECPCGGIRCHDGCCFRLNPALRASATNGLYCCSCEQEMWVRRRPGFDLVVHSECECGGWVCVDCINNERSCICRKSRQLREFYLTMSRSRHSLSLSGVTAETREALQGALGDAERLFAAQLPRKDLLREKQRRQRWDTIATLNEISEKANTESLVRQEVGDRDSRIRQALRVIEESLLE